MPLPSLTAAAEFIAAHAVLLLFAGTAVLLLVTALGWALILNIAPRVAARLRQWQDRHAVQPWAMRLRKAPLFGYTLTRTVGAARYLGLHAAAGFIVAFGALAAFFELAEHIGVDEHLAEFDVALASALALHLSDGVLRAAAFVTHLGDAVFLTVLAALIAVELLRRRERLLALSWITATLGGAVLNRLLKLAFERSRPEFRHAYANVDGWSFPSGHASGSMLVYGLLGYLIVRHTRPAWHIPTVVVTMLLIVITGSSRVLLQVHYFSDVLAGWASAAAWIALCVAGWEIVRRSRSSSVLPTR